MIIKCSNLYTYCHNSPLLNIDLYGLWTFGGFFKDAFATCFPFTHDAIYSGNAPLWQKSLLVGAATFEIISTIAPPLKGATMAAGHSCRAARLVNTMQRTKVVQTAEKAAMEAVSKRVGSVAAKEGLLPILATKEGMVLSRGAESANAGVNLNNKLSLLQSFPQNAAKTRILPDNRIRYYAPETLSRTPGPTRGACNVVEWNPKTGNVRGWYECYDHLGNVNRVHPKNINGQNLSSPHYPLTGAELIR